MVELSEFESLLDALQCADNDQRTKSEETYEAIQPPTRLSLLLQSMFNPASKMESRTLSAVLLRRLLLNQYEQGFSELPEEVRTAVKQQLLTGIGAEQNSVLRKKFADAAAELVRQQFDESGNCTWPEFIAFLFTCMQSEEYSLRETALHLFAAVPLVFGEQQTANLALIGQMLGRALTDPQLTVRMNGMRALSAFVVSNADEADVLKAMKDLLPPALQTIADSIQADPDDDTLLKCLVDVADSAAKYLRPYLSQTLELCFKMMQNADLEDVQRHLALEVIVSLTENTPAAVRKAGKFTESLIQILIRMMTDLEDDPNWALVDETEEEDESSNAITAEMALDRFACAMGGQKVLNGLISTVSPMLGSQNWKERYAALMAISACGEGCHKWMDLMLGSILDSIIPYLSDPHPRVRYASCNAIGQMATDFGPKLQKAHHARVVPALMVVLDDAGNPRVQAHAGAALVNFSENCPKSILMEYLGPLMSKLEQVMSTKFQELREKGTKLVLEQVVTTVASVADTAEERFVDYYDRFMPGLKYIMENANHPDLRLLRGKTIECISLIGLAVGKEKFLPDAAEVMNLLLKTQTNEAEMAADDPQVSYMISAWARMCKLMGRDFEPYLPVVMGQVLRSAQIKPEVCLMDNEEADTTDQDVDWQVVKVGEDQNFAIKTSGLEDKATACQMLVCYARELKEGFSHYCDDVIKIMVPLLKFYFNDDVRTAAAESLPFLLDCARCRGEQYLLETWQYILPNLLGAIASEPEREMLGDDLLSLANCIERMGRGCMTGEQLEELHGLMDRLFKDHFAKHDDRVTKRQDEDYDEVEEERLMGEKDEDEYVLSKLSDVMHALFVTHKTDMLPFFQQLVPHFCKLLEPTRPWSDLQWGICFWDDVIEHTGPLSWHMKDYFVPAIQTGLRHPEEDVRQAAIYGLGVAAMFGGPDYAPLLREAGPSLVEIIQAQNSRSEQFNTSTENAISALTKICKHQPDCVPGGNLDQFLVSWLSWLPVWEDKEETGHVYGFLCDLVEANNPAILGQDHCNLPRIVHAIAQCVHKEGLPEEGPVFSRCLTILRLVQSNEQAFSACLTQLSDEQKASLLKALS